MTLLFFGVYKIDVTAILITIRRNQDFLQRIEILMAPNPITFAASFYEFRLTCKVPCLSYPKIL